MWCSFTNKAYVQGEQLRHINDRVSYNTPPRAFRKIILRLKRLKEIAGNKFRFVE